jgi:hypothetical protein
MRSIPMISIDDSSPFLSKGASQDHAPLMARYLVAVKTSFYLLEATEMPCRFYVRVTLCHWHNFATGKQA